VFLLQECCAEWRSCFFLQHTCNTLQHTAACYNTLQHNAAHCSTLQHTAVCCSSVLHYHTLQHNAALPHTAAQCCTTTHCSTMLHYHTLQHNATYCNTLQHTRALRCAQKVKGSTTCLCGQLPSHCTALHRSATHCITLQHTATHCNTMQHTTTNMYIALCAERDGVDIRCNIPAKTKQTYFSVVLCIATWYRVLQVCCKQIWGRHPLQQSCSKNTHESLSVCSSVLQFGKVCCRCVADRDGVDIR